MILTECFGEVMYKPDQLMAELMSMPFATNFYALRFVLRKAIWRGMDREMIKAVYELWLVMADDKVLDSSYDYSFESVVDYEGWGA